MTQQTDSAHTPLGRFWLRILLVQSLSWLGVLSLFSSNLVLAQTPDAVVLPTIKGLKSQRQLRQRKNLRLINFQAPAPAIPGKTKQKLSNICPS